VAGGQGAQAIPLLKAEIERESRVGELAALLARAYLDDGNDFWALRQVAAAADLHPEDCNLPALAGLDSDFRQGALDQARTLLGRRLLPLAAREDPPGPAFSHARGAAGGASQPGTRHGWHDARAASLAYPEESCGHQPAARQAGRPGICGHFSGRLDPDPGLGCDARAGSPKRSGRRLAQAHPARSARLPSGFAR